MSDENLRPKQSHRACFPVDPEREQDASCHFGFLNLPVKIRLPLYELSVGPGSVFIIYKGYGQNINDVVQPLITCINQSCQAESLRVFFHLRTFILDVERPVLMSSNVMTSGKFISVRASHQTRNIMKSSGVSFSGRDPARWGDIYYDFKLQQNQKLLKTHLLSVGFVPKTTLEQMSYSFTEVLDTPEHKSWNGCTLLTLVRKISLSIRQSKSMMASFTMMSRGHITSWGRTSLSKTTTRSVLEPVPKGARSRRIRQGNSSAVHVSWSSGTLS